MENFTPVSSLLGGMLIGLSALGLLLFSGRVAGVSGIFGGLVQAAFNRGRDGWRWKLAFFAGLVAGGAGYYAALPTAFAFEIERSWWALAVAGLLVGLGTRMSGGCTSGHGVCGISRLSRRSLTATVSFMLTGALTVLLINRALGGAL